MTGDGCPKSMTYGPCGGVGADGSCEVDRRPCPFLGRPIPPPPAHDPVRFTAPADPLLVVDVRAPLGWPGDPTELWARIGDELAGCVPLLGEHVDNLPHLDDSGSLDPRRVTALLAERGVPPIVTITGREHDLDQAAQAMSALHAAGALAIHCVTGDHPAALGIDRPAAFRAESITLVGVAGLLGIPATVAESPAAPGNRAGRLVAKQRAGAAACVLNHGGDAAELTAFADAAAAAGSTLPLIAAVPMVADRDAAFALAAFPGLRLPPGYLQRIIEAPDPGEGLRAAGELAAQLAAGGRFAGINLSGGTRSTDPWDRLALTTRFVRAVRDGWERGRAAGGSPLEAKAGGPVGVPDVAAYDPQASALRSSTSTPGRPMTP